MVIEVCVSVLHHVQPYQHHPQLVAQLLGLVDKLNSIHICEDNIFDSLFTILCQLFTVFVHLIIKITERNTSDTDTNWVVLGNLKVLLKLSTFLLLNPSLGPKVLHGVFKIPFVACKFNSLLMDIVQALLICICSALSSISNFILNSKTIHNQQ